MGKDRIAIRALACAAAMAMLAGGRAHADDRAIKLNYEIEIAGASGIRIETTTRLSDDRYAIDSDVRKFGIIGTLTGSFRSQITSRGKFAANSLTVNSSGGRVQTSDEDRRFTFKYGPDGQLGYVSEPPLEVKKGREVSDAQRKGSFDPVTAAIAALLTRSDPCSGPLAIFDGRRRFDLLIESKGPERVPEGATMGVKDNGLRCDVRMKRIAGYRPDGDTDTELKKPARLWLAKLDESGRMYPVRVEIDVGIGSVIARLTKFDARPLTPEEKTKLEQ